MPKICLPLSFSIPHFGFTLLILSLTLFSLSIQFTHSLNSILQVNLRYDYPWSLSWLLHSPLCVQHFVVLFNLLFTTASPKAATHWFFLLFNDICQSAFASFNLRSSACACLSDFAI